MKVEDILKPSEDPAGRLAEFAADLSYEDIPDEQKDYIKKDILDMMCSFLGGSTGPSVPVVMDSVRSWGATGKGRVLIFGDRLPETLAAFANGVMARAVDLGDTGVTGGHICEWILPALLSGIEKADKPVSGREFITAFAAGAEWGAREHTTIRLQYNNNLVPGECGGSRYATVALAKMYGFDKEQIWDAAGMSYCSHTMTTQQKYEEGTPDARLQHGYVNSDALQICDLVKRGLKSVHGIYMGTAGLMKSIRHKNIESPDLLTEDLGERWVWRDNITNKLYAGCYYNHTCIYGTLAVMKENNIKKEDIQSLHYITSHNGEHTWAPHDQKFAPKTPEAAMFSTPYSVAYAVFTGDCFLDAYRPDTFKEYMNNLEFTDFMNRMSQETDENNKKAFDDYTVVVTLKDGRKIQRFIGDTPGNQVCPMSWEQVINKFWKATRFSAVDLGEDKYNQVIDICRNMEHVEDMRNLLYAMTK